MCGFAAFFEKDRRFNGTLLRQADHDLFHRGPDSRGEYVCDGAAMIFRRLAIIDPQARSDQPYRDISGRYVLVFNGEIYNYKDLRSELSDAGVRLRTSGDTEVIAEGFALWGEAVFAKLDGMFSVVIFDTQNAQVWAARDPLGIKPLYVARQGRAIGLASEMRPLRNFIGRTDVDDEALAELLMFRFAAGRHSNLKGIELVPGGAVLRYSLDDGQVKERRFADVCDTFRPDAAMSAEEADAQSEREVARSVALHMQSDVGYAVQLSGGVDSSLVLALAADKEDKPLESYAVSLPPEAIDEGEYRRAVLARYKTAHTEVALDGKAFSDALPKAVWHMEGPVPHAGCVMLMQLCKQIAKQHKVVLTGEGADEFFGGYARYAQWRDLRLFGRVARLVPPPLWPLLKRYAYLRRFARYDPAVVAGIYFDFLSLHEMFPGLVFSVGARGEVARQFTDFRDRMMAVDQTSYLSSLLMRQDRMSMAQSVEARVPFTHFPLARVLNRIPREIRVPGGETKPVLKRIARKWLPREVVDRRKVGLILPLNAWLEDQNGFGCYLEYLTEPGCRLATWARPGSLAAAVEQFRKHPNRAEQSPLIQLLNVELWLRSLETRQSSDDLRKSSSSRTISSSAR